jgi:hypothetical protein
MIDSPVCRHNLIVKLNRSARALGPMIFASSLLGACASPDGEDSADETGTDTGTDTGTGTGTDEPDEPDEEIPGEPLDRVRWCPELSAPPLQRLVDAEFLAMGPCGDLRSYDGDYRSMLVRADGGVEVFGEPYATGTWLSPRGRVFASFSLTTMILSVRDLDTDTEVEFGFDDTDLEVGFVISKTAPGALAWLCHANDLDLVIEGDRVPLADHVNCKTVVSSGMHSLLAFATLDGTVMLADTDAMSVEPTSLAEFEYTASNILGNRQDSLAMSTSGSYLIHVANEIQDNDGALTAMPIDVTLFDAELDAELGGLGEDSLALKQAPVYGAPLFVLDGSALFVVLDGEAKQLATDTNTWKVLPTPAGPIYVIEGEGEVLRISGPDYATREAVLPVDPANVALRLSPSGTYGSATGETQTCATPSCASMLQALHRFGPEGPLDPLVGTSPWKVVHIYEDGTVLTTGAPVEGPFDSEVALPEPRLLLLAPDNTVLAERGVDPSHTPNGVTLADGRAMVSLSSFDVSDDLLIVDPVGATIEPYPDYDAASLGAGSLYVDALGRRVAMRYHAAINDEGVAWGELE